jgi:aminopeptidase
MLDPRMARLAEQIVAWSVAVEPGWNVLIEASDVPADMVCLLVERIAGAGGRPYVETIAPAVRRALFRNASIEQLQCLRRRDLAFLTEMQGYIALRGSHNSSELADVPPEQMRCVLEHWLRPVTDRRVNHTNWVALRWPTAAMAQQAGMSTAAFEDFFFAVCTLDYARLGRAAEPLRQRLERADAVRVVGPGDTDLRFSVREQPAVTSYGRRNLPDGEVFTSPLRESVEGRICFNTPTLFQGRPFDGVRLDFRAGRVVAAQAAAEREALHAVLDTDPGARSLGEFAFGLNPCITRPMRDILFDEKMAGSVHLALGQAYERADNGNRSAIHWDLILDQSGGGSVWIDGEEIRRDGRFLPSDLAPLNPETLLTPAPATEMTSA